MKFWLFLWVILIIFAVVLLYPEGGRPSREAIPTRVEVAHLFSGVPTGMTRYYVSHPGCLLIRSVNNDATLKICHDGNLDKTGKGGPTWAVTIVLPDQVR